MSLPLNVIVDVLTFSNRNDLDILSEINRYLNRIVHRHFSAKPYRILESTALVVDRDENELLLSLMKYDKTQSAGKSYSFFDFLLRKWIKFEDFNGYAKTYYLETMLYYLPQYVRIAELQINFRTIANQLHPYTPEDFPRLAQLSHVWNGQCVSIYAENDERMPNNHFETISNGIHLALSNPHIISCRQLSLNDALDYVSFRDYPILFLIDVLLISVVDHHIDINCLFDLIEYKAVIPESKTEFVLNIHRSPTALIHMMAALFVNFSTSWICCPLRLIIISKEALHSIITSTEAKPCFRLKNKETKEFLQMKSITEQEANKFCHLNVVQGMKFTIVERFSI